MKWCVCKSSTCLFPSQLQPGGRVPSVPRRTFLQLLPGYTWQGLQLLALLCPRAAWSLLPKAHLLGPQAGATPLPAEQQPGLGASEVAGAAWEKEEQLNALFHKHHRAKQGLDLPQRSNFYAPNQQPLLSELSYGRGQQAQR